MTGRRRKACCVNCRPSAQGMWLRNGWSFPRLMTRWPLSANHRLRRRACPSPSTQPRRRAPHDLDRIIHLRLARHADGLGRHGVQGDVPESATGYGDLRRETIERAAMVSMPPAVLEAAKVRIVHQANVAGLRALDNDQIVFVQMLALVYEFHRQLHGVTQGIT